MWKHAIFWAHMGLACSDTPLGRPIRTDSSGVVITTLTLDDSSLPVWSLSDEPDLTIGGRDGLVGHNLFQVRGAVRLSDGRIVVADGGSSQIRYFNDAGGLVRAVGRQGGGPGEFQRLELLQRLQDDSILVYDTGLQRITVLDPQGGVHRSWPISTSDSIPFPRVVGFFDDRTTLIRRTLDPTEWSGVQQYRYRLYRGTLTGDARLFLGEFRGEERYFFNSNGGVSLYSVPFGRSGAVLASGDRWYVGYNDRFEIEAYHHSGRLVGKVRRLTTPVAVNTQDVDALVVEALGAAPTEERRRRWAQIMADIEPAKTMPAFGAAQHLRELPPLVSDSDANLWVLEYVWQRDSATSWTVIDDGGRAVARVHIPPRHSPLDLGTEYAVLRVFNDLDVETVRVFRLRRN